MTFTDAAAQVLRLVGKPLHYKEITDVAIERNLLSHVGKSPEVTMGARLAALVKKGDKDNPLIRIKPGVFALREWDKETIDKGLADRTPALQRLADQPVEEVVDEQGALAAPAVVETPSGAMPAVEDEETPAVDPAEAQRAEIAAVATGLFAPEDDDDEPILGGTEDNEEDDRLQTERESTRRRRRRTPPAAGATPPGRN